MDLAHNMFTPIKQKKLSEIVFEQIKTAIIEGKLKPGDKLPGERTLAQELGVSRPPVRDAIKQLIFHGNLETRGNTTYIKSITGSLLPDPLREQVEHSRRAYQELAEIRELLETWAASKAAQFRNQDQLDHLERIVTNMANPKLEKQIVKLDLDFHRTIAEMTGNMIYLHQITSIAEVMIPIVTQYREKIMISDEDRDLLLKQHTNIYHHIKNQDTEAAREAMREHIGYTKKAEPHGMKD